MNYFVCVDKKKLKFTIEKTTGVISAEQCLKMEEIPVEYYIKAVLPENYQQYENIQVFNFYKGVGGEAFSLPVKKFIKRQNKWLKNLSKKAKILKRNLV